MRIGFIALSALRAANAELMELGLTLPGFVERSEVIARLPSLGLLTLAGMTPRRFEQSYHEVENIEEFDTEQHDFDVVAISSLSMQIGEAYCLADYYREKGVTVLMGGLHVTACPEEAMGHADAIVLGEGELAWPQLLSDLERGELRSVYDCRGQTFNLAKSPMPRFELLEPESYHRFTVQTQRGCPFDCEFCASSIRLAAGFRAKPVERVMAEIGEIKRMTPTPFIEFADDNTFASKAHGRRLLEELEREAIHWFTETDISVADDVELVRRMKGAGCSQVLVGLESPEAAPLSRLERKANWKFLKRDAYLRSIETLQDHGITVNGCFVMGLDNSDTSSFEAVWEFVQESGLFEIQITIMTPFPGTPLYERLQREGRLLHPGRWELCTLFDVNFRPQRMTVAELEAGFRWLAEKVYSGEATAARRRRFFRNARKRRSERDGREAADSLD